MGRAERWADAAQVLQQEARRAGRLAQGAGELVEAVTAYREARTHAQRDEAFADVIDAGAYFLRALRPYLPPPVADSVTALLLGVVPAGT